ncbi:hypothetical protein Cadr_000019764 [Camelus dromedarius]|uniref:Uncharacterized protein n=1 Tax=Camelus dromedarius TaxID=9838 RepID=A0A5N4D1I1_CAMDR|nr:hypothetical protein Cadr_000019764 [Camelus dromedarius]
MLDKFLTTFNVTDEQGQEEKLELDFEDFVKVPEEEKLELDFEDFVKFRFRMRCLDGEPLPPGTCWGDQSIRQHPETSRASGCQVLAALGWGKMEPVHGLCRLEYRAHLRQS